MGTEAEDASRPTFLWRMNHRQQRNVPAEWKQELLLNSSPSDSAIVATAL